METLNLKKIVKKLYIGTAIYAFIDFSIRYEHGQGITEHIINSIEYMSSVYQSSIDPAIAMTDAIKSDLSDKVNSLLDRNNVELLNFFEEVYSAAAIFYGGCLIISGLKKIEKR